MLITVLAGCDGSSLEVIVFTRQTDWMHPSNPVAAEALQRAGDHRDWHVTVSENPAIFTPARLATTDVVVFSVTSGNILDETARANLETFFGNGGGFVGIHSPSHTEWDWPYYLQKVVPVTFRTHPFPPYNVLPGMLTVETESPIVTNLPRPWMHADEFYSFSERPEDIAGLTMVFALDESQMGPEYTNDYRVGYHPLAFTHELTGGRTFYTALGHTPESYDEPEFMEMIDRSIEWAGKRL